jgi:hypothetical protein
MPGDRLRRILARLRAEEERHPGAAQLCEVCADVTAMTGAGIMLMSGSANQGSVCSSNEVSAAIEELQYTLGEGPCVAAYQQERPVLEPDLADPATQRWPAFAAPAIAAGARAVFGFPLLVGAVRLGALNLYRDAPGPLSDDQHADALVMAGVAARQVLVIQSRAAPGSLAAELEAGSDFHFVVHQASGMVSAQLETSVGQALARLRAYAFANNRPLAEVAEEVVSRALRFDPDEDDDQVPA